ncbi:hypothetical protein HDU87_006156 [Geranomyces variabilis]|uniref:VASt domain-containing protein n=1 Tax=Geranomyces variabilis TaxID=109894 RepID=A0AAD5TH49_9FUNG|nr:hypothetical protein HDU87_006156 [Geranomyces variabilis]
MTAEPVDNTASPASRTAAAIDIIKRPEPAVGGSSGGSKGNEVRRVFSLGALSGPATHHQHHLDIAAHSFSSTVGALGRSISVGARSMPFLGSGSAVAVSDDGDDAVAAAASALASEPAEPERTTAAGLAGGDSTTGGGGGGGYGRALPSRRRPSAASSRQQRSVTTRSGDAVAEAAVALLATADDDEAAAGLASKKRNSDFHDLFSTLPKDDLLVEDYACAWQKEVLIQGRMYLSQRHISFYANLLGWVHSISIPFADVVALDKKYVATFIPNSLEISTATSKYFFASFMHRDVTFGQIKNLWDVAVNQTFQLHPMSASPQASHPSDDLPTPEAETEADRGRDLDAPEAANGNRSLSLDSLQERLKMGGDQVKKRVAAYMNDSTAESKGSKAKDASSSPPPAVRKQVKTPTKNSLVEKVAGPSSASPVDSESPSVVVQETKSRASSLPEGVLKDQVQILVNGLVSPESSAVRANATTTTAEFASNGPPLPHRAAAASAAALTIAIVADEPTQASLNAGEKTPPDADAFSTPAEMAPPVGAADLATAIDSEQPPHPHHHSSHSHKIIHHSHHTRVHHHPHATASSHNTSEGGKKLRRRNPHRPKRVASSLSSKKPAQPAVVASPATCGCEAAHEKMIPVLDAVFNISLEMLWSLLYSQTQTTDGFLKRFLEGKRKCRDMMFHDWVPPDVDLPEPTSVDLADAPVELDGLQQGWQRKLEYVVPLSGPIGPKQTRCKLHETVFQRDDRRSLCIDQISKTPDVPSGTAFQSRAKLCLTFVTATQTRLRVSCEVEWLKSSWLKTPINAAVPDGLKAYHAELQESIEEYARANPAKEEDEVKAVAAGVAATEAAAAVMTTTDGEIYTESESAGSDYEEVGTDGGRDGFSVEDGGDGGGSSSLSHPLEKELAELDGGVRRPGAVRGFCGGNSEKQQQQQRGKGTTAADLRYASDDQTLSPSARNHHRHGHNSSSLTRSFTPSSSSRRAGGSKRGGPVGSAEWRAALRVVVDGVGGWGVVAGACTVFAFVVCWMVKGLVKWEVQRVLSEMMMAEEVQFGRRVAGQTAPGSS